MLGKIYGSFLGNKLEDRLALGILEVDIFLNHKYKMIELAENLREEGYTVNNYSVMAMAKEIQSRSSNQSKEFRYLRTL